LIGFLKFRLAISLIITLSIGCVLESAASGQAVETVSETTENYHGFEATLGVTSRAQALIVFEGRGDERLAVMTGNFVPSPQIYLTTPFHPLGKEVAKGEKTTHYGYYWKYSYNSFSLDRQEDPDTGGIGPASPVYNYGTSVKGDFLAIAPVFAVEMLRPDGSVPFRIELGLGAGYLSLEGDVVLGDQQGQPDSVKTDIKYNGPAFFLFAMGRYYWKAFMLGYQMGITVTSSDPFSFSQSYVSLDVGYRMLF
jgi:hypothetical protein